MDLCLRSSIPCFIRSWCIIRPSFNCNRFRSRASSTSNSRGRPLLKTGGGMPWSWASFINATRRAWATARCSRFTSRDSSASMGCAGPVFFLANTPHSTSVRINAVMAFIYKRFFFVTPAGLERASCTSRGGPSPRPHAKYARICHGWLETLPLSRCECSIPACANPR